jgi:hypothetical protein
MAKNDKHHAEEHEDIYKQNFRRWEEALAMRSSEAQLKDSKAADFRQKKEAQAALQTLRNLHKKSFSNALSDIDSSFTGTETQRSKCISFFKSDNSQHLRETRQLFFRFYFDNVAVSKTHISTFPNASLPVNEQISSSSSSNAEMDAVCNSCSVELIVDSTFGSTVCPVCSEVRTGGFGIGMKQTFSEFSSSTRGAAPYIRVSHFREFISRLEGSERTIIPSAVILSVLQACELLGFNPIEQPEKLTYSFIRKTLRDAGFAEFFENVSQIRSLVSTKPMPRFTDLQREQLQRLFMEIQEPFEKHRGERKNFLSYAFITRKLCELLGYFEFLPFLPIFKAVKNRDRADEVWRKICEDINIEFVPT